MKNSEEKLNKQVSVPNRITFGAKENHAVTFTKLQEAFLAGLRTEGITSILCTVSIDSKEIPALYQMRWGHLQESELDEIPVTGITTGMEKLTGKQFEALEKQMRKAVNALRSGEQGKPPSSTLKTPNPTAPSSSKNSECQQKHQPVIDGGVARRKEEFFNFNKYFRREAPSDQD